MNQINFNNLTANAGVPAGELGLPLMNDVRFETADLEGIPAMTRVVALKGIPEHVKSLREALELGEEHFGAIARHGVATPPHSWGVTPIVGPLEQISHHYQDPSSQRLLPEGHLLVARATSITPVPTPAAKLHVPALAIRNYNASQTLPEQGIRLADPRALYGSIAPNEMAGQELPPPPQFWLREIDLVFREV